MSIYGVSFDLVGKQPIVLLKTVDGNRFLPIWIGHPEAAAILARLRGEDSPRPMTHDLFVRVLGDLEAELVQIAVTELRENTFYATLTLRRGGKTTEVDSRPSDAIALAVRLDTPIFASDDVIASSSIEMDDEPADAEDQIAAFKQFLDDVRPEDFGST
jgi:uncharacterized protein